MKAVRIAEPSGPKGLAIEDVPTPVPGPDEIAVRVQASGVNRADLLQSLGRYPAPAGVRADIPGLEYAGEVIEVGSRVVRFKVGDRVMGVVGGGAWAEVLVTHEREAIAVPSSLTTIEAAAVPEAFLTAWDALVVQGGLRPGTDVLIHGAGGGVGTAAVQVAALHGARTIATGRSQAKFDRLRSLTETHSILVDANAPKFAEAVRQFTSGRGVDVVLDLVGGDWLPETIRCVAPTGTIMLVGLVAGLSANVPLGALLMDRVRIQGTVLRSRPPEERMAVARRFEKELVWAFATKALRPVVDSVVPMSEVSGALKRLTANEAFGKIVLTW
jgi:putative PIG3 family NAD(P)H quinone oxidoreductase